VLLADHKPGRTAQAALAATRAPTPVQGSLFTA